MENGLPQGTVPQSTLERHLTTISKAPISAAARQELTTEAIVADSLAANAMLRNEAAKNKLVRTESMTKRKRSVSETGSLPAQEDHTMDQQLPITKQRRFSGSVVSDMMETSSNTVKVPPPKTSTRRGKPRTDLPSLPVNAGGVVRKHSPSNVPKEDMAAKGLAEMATPTEDSIEEQHESHQPQWSSQSFGGTPSPHVMNRDGKMKPVQSSDLKMPPSMHAPSPRENRGVMAQAHLAPSPQQLHPPSPRHHAMSLARPLPQHTASTHLPGAVHRPPPPSKYRDAPKQRPSMSHHAATQASSHVPNPQSHMYYSNQAPRESMEWETYESHPAPIIVKGTVDDLVKAAEKQDKVDEAIAIMRKLKDTAVTWSDSEDEEEEYDETKEDVIVLPGFKSKIPSLPVEPEYKEPEPAKDNRESDGPTSKHSTSLKAKKATTGMTVDYPYAVDNWWPSVGSIRKERRADGEKSDEEDFTEEPKLSAEPVVKALQPQEKAFRANGPAIRKRLATTMEPGVLEKLPHCRIHRMAMRQMKVASAPDHAFCWQVTENYSHEPMVCCSVCNTWRHASCGGHYKAVTIRDTMHQPFVPLCDRCHEEQEYLKEQKEAQIRLEKQRVEHLRRTLQTTAVIRHAAFAKHAGTNKWPLGSVNPSHLTAHTRSVQSRHDKSEKLWADMANKLSGKTVGSRPKDRIKARSRELERLLTSVEDAENETDRHNMMLFLQLDSSRRHPIGFEKRRRNIFDPADDDLQTPASLYLPPAAPAYMEETDRLIGRGVTHHRKSFTGHSSAPPLKCARGGCLFRPRFDSVFCSDACGVSALELDLYKSLQYASHMHPHTLRA